MILHMSLFGILIALDETSKGHGRRKGEILFITLSLAELSPRAFETRPEFSPIDFSQDTSIGYIMHTYQHLFCS